MGGSGTQCGAQRNQPPMKAENEARTLQQTAVRKPVRTHRACVNLSFAISMKAQEVHLEVKCISCKTGYLIQFIISIILTWNIEK